MSTIEELLPLTQRVEAREPGDVVDLVRSAAASGSAIYPLGGETALNYGLRPSRPGIGLSLRGLNQVVDYPARDMTVTVQAGVALADLNARLAAEGQYLPLDVPHAGLATLGGIVATNWNGPTRLGCGTVRDHVIGISGVDGRGTAFKAGGRVVKNVAGYDFCKLLTGSLGTLAVVTQVTLKVRPLPPAQRIVACRVDGDEAAERKLAALVHSRCVPEAIELLSGPAWEACEACDLSAGQRLLAVLLRGTTAEVDWMSDQLAGEWADAGEDSVCRLEPGDPDWARFWQLLCEFPADSTAALVVQASVVRSGVVPFMRAAREVDPQVSLQAHAGSGIVVARFPEFPAGGLSRTLIQTLQPAAAAHHGHVVLLSNPGGVEMTPRSVWDADSQATALMQRVKRQFDPHDVLNPGRFVFP